MKYIILAKNNVYCGVLDNLDWIGDSNWKTLVQEESYSIVKSTNKNATYLKNKIDFFEALKMASDKMRENECGSGSEENPYLLLVSSTVYKDIKYLLNDNDLLYTCSGCYKVVIKDV